MTLFDYDKFIQIIQLQFKDLVTETQLKEWLDLDDDYNKDSPASIGKTLIISRLRIKGKKNNDSVIDYDQNFSKGITVWIADNGQGKSSIFKMIKYCLTGDNSIKKDVKSWIKELLMEFKIGENTYTVLIDKSSRISEGWLYGLSISDYDDLKAKGKIEVSDSKSIFTFKGDESLSNQLQTFFFNQFSFYSLKYTTKSSVKDDLSLKTANLSWSTYFKTIYLESSAHEYLFLQNDYGKQGSKIFEMILGLRLTYPINRLTLLMNLEDEHIGKLRLFKDMSEKKPGENTVELEKELNQIDINIGEFKIILEEDKNVKGLIDEQIAIQNAINVELDRFRITQTDHRRAIRRKEKLEEEVTEFERDLKSASTEFNRLQKQIINMQTYRDVEGFFTNLEIKSCPHCDSGINEDRMEIEKHNHVCGLCGSNDLKIKVDVEEINQKMDVLNSDKSLYKLSVDEIIGRISVTKKKIAEQEKEIIELYATFSKGPTVKNEEERLNEIKKELDKIQKERLKRKKEQENLELLKQRRAVLVYRIEEAKKPVTVVDNSKEINERLLKKQVFGHAIVFLRQQRQQLNAELIDKLEGLILNEINTFGLKNIAKASITSDYNISVLQNGEDVSFDELNESEKLRVKFAFYLSLIQLDIEYKLGRHPRFLIIDSPGSEEISKRNLNGLSDIFKEVNRRFGNELQIFMGTTLQEFSQVSSSQQIFHKATDEFIF